VAGRSAAAADAAVATYPLDNHQPREALGETRPPIHLERDGRRLLLELSQGAHSHNQGVGHIPTALVAAPLASHQVALATAAASVTRRYPSGRPQMLIHAAAVDDGGAVDLYGHAPAVSPPTGTVRARRRRPPRSTASSPRAAPAATGSRGTGFQPPPRRMTTLATVDPPQPPGCFDCCRLGCRPPALCCLRVPSLLARPAAAQDLAGAALSWRASLASPASR